MRHRTTDRFTHKASMQHIWECVKKQFHVPKFHKCLEALRFGSANIEAVLSSSLTVLTPWNGFRKTYCICACVRLCMKPPYVSTSICMYLLKSGKTFVSTRPNIPSIMLLRTKQQQQAQGFLFFFFLLKTQIKREKYSQQHYENYVTEYVAVAHIRI